MNIRKSSSNTGTVKSIAQEAVKNRLLRTPSTRNKVTNVSVQNSKR